MSEPPKQQRSINSIARVGVNKALSVDVWNSSATGHQIADTAPGMAWRESRNIKLRSQFKSKNDGGARMFHTSGPGALDRTQKSNMNMTVPRETRLQAGTTVVDMVTKSGAMETLAKKALSKDVIPTVPPKHRSIFDGVTVYINGSTLPLVSDHKLKQILSENGATVSLNLARRKVTHVVLGRTATAGRGSGGGLAGGKIEREIHRTGGAGVRYVTVDWVLDSLKAGKRLPETRFSGIKMAQKQQKSVYDMFKRPT